MENRLPLRISLGLILAVMVAYLPVIQCDFVNFDDPTYVRNNPHVNTGLTRDNVVWAWTSFYAANWHPLTWMSHQLDCQWFGLRARQHHIVNVIWHIASTVGLFLVLRRMTGEDWRPALVAALFGLHPLHVESVAWISERKDVLSTFFAIVTLGMYALYAARPSLGRYLAVVVAFVLGLLCKPMLVTWPFVLLLMDYWPLRRCSFSPRDDGSPRFAPAGWKRLILEKLPLLLLALASACVTVLAQKRAMRPSEHLALGFRLGNAVVSYADYLRKMVWPMDLAAFYQHQGRLLPMQPVVISGLILLLLTLAVLLGFRKRPALLVGWLWYLGTLVPVIGLVQVGVQSMADRYTYIPLIGLFLAIAWSIPSLPESAANLRAATGLAASGLLLACLVLTFRQIFFWRDDETLWRRVVDAADSSIGRCYYGLFFYDYDMPEEAERQFEIALRMHPNSLFALTVLGDFQLDRGKLEQALAYYRKAEAVAPNNAGVRGRLGQVFACLERNEEARLEFEAACREESEKPFNIYKLGAVLDRLGDRGGAEQAYQEGRKLDPDYIEKTLASAEDYCGGRLKRKNSPPYALFLAEQVCGASDPPRPEMYRTLAKALALNDRPFAAVAAARRALALAERNGQTDLLSDLHAQVHSYELLARRRTILTLTAPANTSLSGCLIALTVLLERPR
jgi:tetratricopeptide (TPR) repeat protein